MTTLLEVLRYQSGVAGEEAADLIEQQELEIADHEKAYALLFAENAHIKAEAEAAVKQARIDALEEAKTLIENYPVWLGTRAPAICAAIESLKGKTP